MTIAEKKDGTYLEFRDPDTDTPRCEVLVSPAMISPRNNIGPYSEEAYTFAIEPAENSEQIEEMPDTESVNSPEEIDRLIL